MDDMKEGMESEVARLERTQDRLIGERDAARAEVERLKAVALSLRAERDEARADSHVKDVCLWLTVGENHPTVHASAAVYLLPEQARMVGRMLLDQADAAEGKVTS